MAGRGDARAAGRVYENWNFGKCCFQEQGIGYHADIGAQARKFQLRRLFRG